MVSIFTFIIPYIEKKSISSNKISFVKGEAEGGKPSAIWMENRNQEKNIVGRAENSN